MNLNELPDYRNWLHVSPEVVRRSVINVGGWQKVFSNRLPRWASKVRNYFNETPQTLTLLDKRQSSKELAKAQKYIRNATINPVRPGGTGGGFGPPVCLVSLVIWAAAEWPWITAGDRACHDASNLETTDGPVAEDCHDRPAAALGRGDRGRVASLGNAVPLRP